MKFRRIIRVSTPLALAALLMIPTFTMAQASSPPGMGFHSGYIWRNDKRYSATLTLGGTVNDGGFSFFTTDAYCERYHSGVKVTFDTFGAGYQTYTGLSRTQKQSGTSYSWNTKYGGKDTPLSITRIEGRLNAKVTNDNGTVPQYNFSASLY